MAKTTYTVTRELAETDKLAPQAKVIIQTILNKVGVGVAIEKAAVVAELEAAEADETSELRLKTRQGVDRIVAFYQPRLTETGLLEVVKEKAEKAPKAEGEKKPRKAKAAAEPAEAVA